MTNSTMKNDPEFNEQRFWTKINGSAKRAGIGVIEIGVKLFYTMRDSDTPAWAKTAIAGALIYFITPIDLLPDFIPGGYVDDMGTLLAAFSSIRKHVKEEHQKKAKEKIQQWFQSEKHT